MLSAADKMDDFESIAVVQIGRRPLRSRHDFAVQLNRNAVTFHAEVVN